MSGALVLAAGEAPSSHVSLHVLLTYLQTGALAFVTDAVLVALAAAYLIGVRRLRARGRHWSIGRTAAYLGALVGYYVAVGSGLAAYDDINLSAHVVQHMLLMMVGPPLLALGRPVTLLAQAGGRSSQVRVVRIVNSRVVEVLSSPLAWAIYYGSMWVYFVTPLYAFSASHDLFHDASHLYFAAVGYLFWQSIVGLDGTRRRVQHGARLFGLLLGAPLEAFLGLTIMNMNTPIAPGYSLSGTHAGGAVFWITSMLVMAVATIVSLYQWMRSEARSAVRLDAKLDREEAIAASELSAEELEEFRRTVAPGPGNRLKPRTR